jgi:hypothetical protein
VLLQLRIEDDGPRRQPDILWDQLRFLLGRPERYVARRPVQLLQGDPDL